MQVVSELPIFEEIPRNDIPYIYKQPATVVRPSDSTTPILKLASADYTLKHYLNEKPHKRPAFFSPEYEAGPDLIFFIKLTNGQIMPVTVQLKLRKNLTKLDFEEALSTCNPYE